MEQQTLETCDSCAGGVITGAQIERLGIIVQMDKEQCLKESSYDLRLGAEYLDIDGEIKKLTDDSPKLTIPPYGAMVISTYENLKMPNNLVGRFDLRIQYGLRGLMLQVGTQVEPEYKGKLFGLLFNLSDSDVDLYYKQSRIFTIEFSGLKEPVEVKDKDEILTLAQFLNKMVGEYVQSGLQKIHEDLNTLKPNIEVSVDQKIQAHKMM